MWAGVCASVLDACDDLFLKKKNKKKSKNTINSVHHWKEIFELAW